MTQTPNSNHGEILYHPVLKTFAIVQEDTRTFSSFTELLRHMHVLHQLELRRIQRAIIKIQRAWTEKEEKLMSMHLQGQLDWRDAKNQAFFDSAAFRNDALFEAAKEKLHKNGDRKKAESAAAGVRH